LQFSLIRQLLLELQRHLLPCKAHCQISVFTADIFLLATTLRSLLFGTLVAVYVSGSSALALPESLLGYVSLCSGATTSLELDFKDIVSDFSAVGESTVLPSVEVLDFVWFFYYAFLCKANFHYFDNGMFCSY
jgi:hypothetical protein